MVDAVDDKVEMNVSVAPTGAHALDELSPATIKTETG